jgi:hypothetical protein
MKPLTCVYCGNFRPSFSTESHVLASLEELGHEVVALQEDEIDTDQTLAVVKATNADLMMWTRTWNLKGDAFKMLRELPCPSVAFHLDLYAGLKRDGGIDREPWWKCKYVFSADGGSDAFFKEHGVNHFWSPPGVFGQECYAANPDPTQGNEICFTGSFRGYHSEWKYREQLIEWLMETYGSRFSLYEHSSRMRGHPLNVLYASSKVVIGDSLNLGFCHEKYWSDRTHEVPGRFGMLITGYVKPLEDFYVPDKEMVFYKYGDFDELKSKIDYYLSHDEEREVIRLAGHERTKRDHTYKKRLERVLQIVGENEGWEC